MYEDFIFKEIEGSREYSVALRRHFHRHPELSKQEYKTAEKIEEELHSFGLDTKRVAGTGVYAEIKGMQPGSKTIVLRADTDALPVTEEHYCAYTSENKGVMHACGHDAHTASLLTAARFLASHRDLFGGTVRLTFQQAEEVGYGALRFIEEGYLDGADRTFGVHTESRTEVGKVSLTPGPNNASVDWFRITVKGKEAHVSTPDRGVDALYAACQIVTALQALVTRRINPTESVLIGIGKLNAGTSYNILAKEAAMEGTIRAMLPEIREKVIADLERLAGNIAESFGAEAVFEWGDYSSPLINDPVASAEAQKVCARLIGAENVITNRPHSLGGDDFAEYIIKVPGVYAFVGSGNDSRPETRVAHHDSHFDVDERCLTIAAALYAAYAVNFLNGTIDN